MSTIHYFGGTLLGSSRGKQDSTVMADRLEELGVNLLFVIGGDGSQRGAPRESAIVRTASMAWGEAKMCERMSRAGTITTCDFLLAMTTSGEGRPSSTEISPKYWPSSIK